MNILFVYSIDDAFSPARPLRTPEQMQFGISYISSVLKKAGHHTHLIVLSRLLGRQNEKTIDAAFRQCRPGLVALTAVSTEYSFMTRMAGYIKNRYPDAYLLIGGPHVSLSPEGVLGGPFDALCIGEGEYPTLELVRYLEAGKTSPKIQNLWIKNEDGIEENPTRPFLQDLDDLPFPDPRMWQDWIEEGEGSRQPVLLGRGCPFECTYCCNHALKRIAKGRYVRFRSSDNIISEIKEIVTRYPDKRNIYLEVETIGADKEWSLELCSKLARFNASLKKPLSFGVNLRIAPNIDFEALFDAFKGSNFTDINIGVESGSERVRREILNRHYSNDDIVNVVRLARRYGLKVRFYNLIGIPGETFEDFKETINVNRLCLPEHTYTHIFFPYPGTKLYRTCKEEGLLKDDIGTKLERTTATVNLPGFTKRQIQKGFIWFDYYVYKGYKPIWTILAKVLVSKLRSNSRLHFFYRHFTYLPLYKWVRSVLKRFIPNYLT